MKKTIDRRQTKEIGIGLPFEISTYVIKRRDCHSTRVGWKPPARQAAKASRCVSSCSKWAERLFLVLVRFSALPRQTAATQTIEIFFQRERYPRGTITRLYTVTVGSGTSIQVCGHQRKAIYRHLDGMAADAADATSKARDRWADQLVLNMSGEACCKCGFVATGAAAMTCERGPTLRETQCPRQTTPSWRQRQLGSGCQNRSQHDARHDRRLRLPVRRIEAQGRFQVSQVRRICPAILSGSAPAIGSNFCSRPAKQSARYRLPS